MIGDGADMRRRLRLALPDRWFADDAPVLDGVLAGLGSAWAGLHGLLAVVRVQSRRLTATGAFLDMTAQDLFGGRLPRWDGEDDARYRARVGRALRRARATRAGLVDAAAELGATVQVFEPARPLDTGVWGGAGLGYGVAGGWGSLQMPLECLVVARRGPSAETDVRLALVDVLPAGGVAWLRFEG